jgi:hypothetical protein
MDRAAQKRGDVSGIEHAIQDDRCREHGSDHRSHQGNLVSTGQQVISGAIA